MSEKGHMAYNKAPTKEELRKWEGYVERETRSSLLTLDLKDDKL